MSSEWSKEELSGAIDAYLEMQDKEHAGQVFIKKRYYEELASQFDRTEKSFEYRMQNISYVLSLMGRNWLTGLKPAKNVGANVATEIETLLNQAEDRKSIPIVAFEIAVQEQVKKKNLLKPIGNRNPEVSSSKVTQFQRDTTVKAWVLQQANGKCENCEQTAPFKSTNGLPYLEVHHVRQLADKGTDTVTNTVALCPNCHRELHYGENSQVLVTRLYERVNRLTRE